VDRAALDFAIAHGIEHGGWCPLGRLAEDGGIPERYHLHETATSDPAERTELNVADSDATVIIVRDLPLAGGTLLTEQAAQRYQRPLLIVPEVPDVEHAAHSVAAFLDRNGVKTLNVAGPRESEAPELSRFVEALLLGVFSKRKNG
jgi:hypothetical protein